MPLIPLQLVGDSARFNREVEVTVNAQTGAIVAQPAPATAGVTAPVVSVLKETHAATEFTDGLGADGTLTLTATPPAGAFVLGCVITAVTGFAEDTSCSMIVGTAADPDRWMTGTPDVFNSVASGPAQDGRPSGLPFARSATATVVTITSNADITPVIAGAGVATISIYYIATGLM